MTKQEAMKLENRCDKIMSGYLGKKCTVSMALTGKLKVEFNDGDYITCTTPCFGVDYVSFTGCYDDLVEKIKQVKECFEDNLDIFNQLLWTYHHRSELEE